jgi:serine/threonine-protein kinase
VPGYDLLGVLGRGGMGVVYQARQQGLKRLVALKMILAGSHAGPAEVARFQAEAEAVARLQHPNIVQVYEVGKHGGYPFLSLEYVGGGSLAQRFTGTPQPPPEAARLVETLARAMHYAHQRGILHRDLKPANVLLTEDGIPKVADFGLAKQLDVQTGQTQSGSILGTPSYMAPEQAAGLTHALGPAVDIYALGAILYEALTGRPPFTGATALDTLDQVRNQESVPPSRLQPKVPVDLETICLKCIQKEPTKRYASALDLADDLRRFLNREPIRARPTSRAERLQRWCRRNPVVASLVAAVAVLLVSGTAVATHFAVQASAQARQALQEKERADDNARQALHEKERADDNARQAQNNADRATISAASANEQRNLALESLNTLVVDVQEQLRDTPATFQLKKHLLETAMQGLARISKSADATHAGDLSLADARNRLGDIFLQLGNSAPARREYEAALQAATQLVRLAPDNRQAQGVQARAYGNLASASLATGDWTSALQFAQEAVTRNTALVDAGESQAQSALASALSALGQASLKLGDLPSSRAAYQRMLALNRKLAEARPGDAAAQLALAAAHDALGGICRQQHDYKAAVDAYQKAVTLTRGVLAADAKQTRARLAQAGSLTALGETSEEADQSWWAPALYRQAYDIELALAAADPQNVPYKIAVIEICERLGLVNVKLGFGGTSREFYQHGLGLVGPLVEADPGNLRVQRLLRALHEHLGDVSVSWGGQVAARNHFQDACRVAELLVAAQSADVQARQELLIVYQKLAIANLETGRLVAARDVFSKAQPLAATLAADPANQSAATDLVGICRRLGEVYFRLDDLTAARQWQDKAVALLEARQPGPDNPRLLAELRDACRAAAATRLRAGELAQAQDDFQKALTIAQSLARAEPRNGDAPRSVAAVCADLAGVAAAMLDFDQAVRWQKQAVEVWESLAKEGKLRQEAAQMLPTLRMRLTAYSEAQHTANKPAVGATQAKPLARQLLALRIRVLAVPGQHAAAAEAVRQLKALNPADANNLFEAARGYAVCMQALAPAPPSRQLSADQQSARAVYARLALESLSEALDHGFNQPALMRIDRDLEPIRKEPAYAALLKRARGQAQDPDARVLQNSLGMDLVLIPRGRFQIGSSEDAETIAAVFNKPHPLYLEKPSFFIHERPQHEVELTRPFYLGATEVTMGQFRAFVAATGYRTDAERDGQGGGNVNPTTAGSDTSAFSWQRSGHPHVSEDHPVCLVSWNDANEFCRWLSRKEEARYRLPTEAEWEYACRAGTTTRYWTGDDPNDLLQVANVPDATFRDNYERANRRPMTYQALAGRDGFSGPAPVGEFKPNPFGLYDMHGNLWEWCLDDYDARFYERRLRTDPVNTGHRDSHTMRGGCYM